MKETADTAKTTMSWPKWGYEPPTDLPYQTDRERLRASQTMAGATGALLGLGVVGWHAAQQVLNEGIGRQPAADAALAGAAGWGTRQFDM